MTTSTKTQSEKNKEAANMGQNEEFEKVVRI